MALLFLNDLISPLLITPLRRACHRRAVSAVPQHTSRVIPARLYRFWVDRVSITGQWAHRPGHDTRLLALPAAPLAPNAALVTSRARNAPARPHGGPSVGVIVFM